MPLLMETNFPNLFYQGKVRDTYEIGSDLFLLVVTDRVSAFDSVLPNGIPDKGTVLNQLSAFWFEHTRDIIPNHVVEVVNDVKRLNAEYGDKASGGRYSFPDYIERRSMIVRKAERIDIECVVRGYLSGSAWDEYRKKGKACGISLPAGLLESEQLPQPIFTPTTKADTGHDEPITIDEMRHIVGGRLTDEIMEKSLAIYDYAARYARSRGIIIADTKMEYGLIDGTLILIDELLTPDSSRFWDADNYSPGRPQPSFDKQPLRDWLVSYGWNKQPPAPELPPDVVEGTAERYRKAYRMITGKEL